MSHFPDLKPTAPINSQPDKTLTSELALRLARANGEFLVGIHRLLVLHDRLFAPEPTAPSQDQGEASGAIGTLFREVTTYEYLTTKLAEINDKLERI